MASNVRETTSGNDDYETEAIVVAPEFSWDAMNESNDDDNTEKRDDSSTSKNVFINVDYKSMLYNDSDSVDNDDDDYDYGKRKRHKKSDKNKSKKIESKKIELTASEYSKHGSNKLEVDGLTELLEDVDMPTKKRYQKTVLVEDGNRGVEVPEGWQRMVFMRTSGMTSGSFDVYYTSPLGKRLRSKKQVEKYCQENGLEIDLNVIKFNHRANDSQKSALYRKATTDLAVDITTETEDNQMEIFKNPEDVYIPDGWSRRVFQRLQGKHAGKLDVIYIDPNGRKFRSKIEITRYFSENNIQADVNVEAMCFGYGQRGFLPVLPEHLKGTKSSPIRKAPRKTRKLSLIKNQKTSINQPLNKTQKTSENQPLNKTQMTSENHSEIFNQDTVPESGPDGKVEDGLFSLKWNNHKTTFFDNLKILREKYNYTDATLAVEGKFYPVHKLVMSTCSEYFSDIFERTPCKSPVIVLQDVRSRDIEALLDYMYVGQVNVNQSDLASLLKTAECLRIKGFAFPDENLTKLCKNSTNSHHDTHWDSPPRKRRRHDSNTIPSHAPAPVPSPQMYATALDNPAQTPPMPPHSTSNTDQDGPSIEDFVKVEMDLAEESNTEQDETPVVKIEMGDDEEEEEQDKRVSKGNNYEGGARSDGDPGGDYESDTSKTEHEPETDSNTSIPKPSLQQSSVGITIEIGHRATVRQTKTKEGLTHDWEVFVQGNEGASLESFVEKVVFTLHESFPKPKRVIKTPPYRVAEKGYGSFALPIEIFFKTNEEHKKHRLEYDLFLQPLNEPPINTVNKEHLTFHKPGDDFMSKLLAGGGELQCSSKDDSSAENDQSGGAHPSSDAEIKAHSNSQQGTKKRKTNAKQGEVHWDEADSSSFRPKRYSDDVPTSRQTRGGGHKDESSFSIEGDDQTSQQAQGAPILSALLGFGAKNPVAVDTN